jgi:CheY-like chemotaxis protein
MSTAALPGREPRVTLLLADDDPGLRTLLAARAGLAVASLAVLEAEDGAEAVQLGLQKRPGLALLDVQMPRLGGIEAAITLRELQPHMRIALCTAQPDEYRDRALELGLPLFDKLDLERAMHWLELQARELRHGPGSRMLSLHCSVCGYGAVRPAPPDRCPMCQGEGTWLRRPSPLTTRAGAPRAAPPRREALRRLGA